MLVEAASNVFVLAILAVAALEVFSEQDELISVTSMANETCATVVPEAVAAEAVAAAGKI